MATPADTVRSFYATLAAGEVEKATSLMTDDIQWVTVEALEDDQDLLSAFISQTLADRYSRGWAFKMNGRSCKEVSEFILLPFIKEGSSFAPSPIEFRAENDKVVWLGSVTRIEKPTGEPVAYAYAHTWTVRDGKVARLRQYIYIPAAANGRPQ
jgi:hypothetical protein